MSGASLLPFVKSFVCTIDNECLPSPHDSAGGFEREFSRVTIGLVGFLRNRSVLENLRNVIEFQRESKGS